MKHSDFNLQLRNICEQEKKELFEAIKLHNGCYEWEIDSKHPEIAVFNGDDWNPYIGFVEVKKVAIENNSLLIFIVDDEDDSYEIELSQVLAGFLSRIIDALPEPVRTT